MEHLNNMYSKFDDMYKKLKEMKKRFEDIKEVFEEADKQVEEMRRQHAEETIKIFETLERRDVEIRKYLEQREQERINHLLIDIGGLIDEMFEVRLRILDDRYETGKNKKS